MSGKPNRRNVRQLRAGITFRQSGRAGYRHGRACPGHPRATAKKDVDARD